MICHGIKCKFYCTETLKLIDTMVVNEMNDNKSLFRRIFSRKEQSPQKIGMDLKGIKNSIFTNGNIKGPLHTGIRIADSEGVTISGFNIEIHGDKHDLYTLILELEKHDNAKSHELAKLLLELRKTDEKIKLIEIYQEARDFYDRYKEYLPAVAGTAITAANYLLQSFGINLP